MVNPSPTTALARSPLTVPASGRSESRAANINAAANADLTTGLEQQAGRSASPPTRPTPRRSEPLRSVLQQNLSSLRQSQQAPCRGEAVGPTQGDAAPQDLIPPELWAHIAQWADYDRLELRRLNRAQAEYGTYNEKNIAITQAAHLALAVEKFSPGGILRLNASCAGIGHAHAPLLAQLNIPEMNLSHNRLSLNTLRQLLNNPHLVCLKLDGCRLGNRGAQALGRALASNSTLRHLSLADNGIGPQGAAALSQASSLETLNLSDNDIETTGVNQLLNAHQLDSLVELDLSHNPLIDPLARPLDCIPKLSKLNLQGTYIPGLDLENFLVNNPQITTLTLSGPELDVDADSVRALQNSHVKALTLIDVSSYSHNFWRLGRIKSLRTLDLSHCTFERRNIRSILAGNPKLEAIRFTDGTHVESEIPITLAHSGLLHPEVNSAQTYRDNYRILHEQMNHFVALSEIEQSQPLATRADSLNTVVMHDSLINETGLRALLANRNIRHLDLRGALHLQAPQTNENMRRLLEAARTERDPLPDQPERMRFDTLLF